MAIKNKFEPDQGFRFFNDQVSILVHAIARVKQGETLSNLDLNNFFRATNKYLQSVAGYSVEKQAFSKILTADNFPEPEEVECYKFMQPTSLNYILGDSFQFGSIQYYRDIESQSSKDSMEGLSNLAISTPKHLVCASLVGGYNFGIFCGTSLLDNKSQMTGRFGQKIIKIKNLRGFAEDVRSALGAKRYFVNHVTYNDLKLFRVRTLRSFRLHKPNAPNDNFDPEMINESVFRLLYDGCFLSSLYMKPTRFSVERELRLVFDMPHDVPNVLRVTGRGLAKHIEVIN